MFSPANIIVKEFVTGIEARAAERSAMMLFCDRKNSARAEEPSIGL
jgi:hypothetical protein